MAREAIAKLRFWFGKDTKYFDERVYEVEECADGFFKIYRKGD